ncbi:hypothetical protein AN641_06570 [Candidatus Epulonipiscioides gigas]|nr:hypothetical protein AN641_06570 [Epulopiscium sp. SCG-C07WGA-EpuloA2]
MYNNYYPIPANQIYSFRFPCTKNKLSTTKIMETIDSSTQGIQGVLGNVLDANYVTSLNYLLKTVSEVQIAQDNLKQSTITVYIGGVVGLDYSLIPDQCFNSIFIEIISYQYYNISKLNKVYLNGFLGISAAQDTTMGTFLQNLKLNNSEEISEVEDNWYIFFTKLESDIGVDLTVYNNESTMIFSNVCVDVISNEFIRIIEDDTVFIIPTKNIISSSLLIESEN